MKIKKKRYELDVVNFIINIYYEDVELNLFLEEDIKIFNEIKRNNTLVDINLAMFLQIEEENSRNFWKIKEKI
jgi:hypothetical protein